MRILFATPVPPSLLKPRPHFFIRALAERGHHVHLLTQVADTMPLSALPGWSDIRASCATIDSVRVPPALSLARSALSVPTTTPLRVAYCRSSSYAAVARELVRRHRCDSIHVDRERLAPVFRSFSLPKVLDATDSITLYLRRTLRYGPPVERAVAGMELIKMPRFERGMAKGYSSCLVTSEEDAQALERKGCGAPVEIVPNGVDEKLFSYDSQSEPNSLLFVGNMFYPPNVDAACWFAKRVFPRIKEARPQSRLRLVGDRPLKSVKRLAGIKGVEVTGRVPSVADYLRRATVFVAPMRIGGGFPNKVAEALASGLPVVATPAAHGGLPEIQPGRHLLEASDASDFSSKTIDLLDNPSLRANLAAGGRALMQQHYSWSDVGGRLEEVHRAGVEGFARQLSEAV